MWKMKSKNVFFRMSGFVAVLLTASVTYAQTDLISQKITQLLQSVRTVSPRATGVGQGPDEPARLSIGTDGYLRYLGAPPLGYFPASSVVPGKPEETAYNFLKEHTSLLGATSAAVDFKVLKSRTRDNRNYVRFEQTYAGLSIFGGQIITQLNSLGGVEYVLSDIARNTQVLDKGTVSIAPALSSTEAAAKARELIATENPGFELRTTTPQLIIFDPSVVGAAGSIHLVWDMRVYSEETVHISEHILLDAHSGEVVRHYPLNKHALNRQIHDANNTTADPGTLERQEGGAASGIADVDDAYDFFGDTYDFYNTNHARDSIDGGGMVISVTVRYCDPGDPCPWNNAMWSPNRNRLYIGNDWAVDDIVAHEYTHGVTDNESDLIYENHSGAINESFSDVWGEFVDLGNGAGTDTAAVSWEIGEDLSGGAIRDMSDPNIFGDPDRLRHPNFIAPVPIPNRFNDFGGVHTNSGVNNKLCYLLTDGDTFRGRNIAGMGIARVADLYYEVNANLLTSGADYFDLGNTLEQAAVNLKWNTRDRNNLYRACLAVEIADAGKGIYVDRSYSGPEDGSQAHPFNTVVKGLNDANPGDYLFIKSGSYNEILTLDKIMELNTWGAGTVIIGR
jgi:Zn-dependent metalloprotease